MENLIKTKKLETRFFLNAATAHLNNNSHIGMQPTTAHHSKPGTSHSKAKDRREMLNTTAPLNLNLGSLNSSNGGGSGSNNMPIYSSKNSNRLGPPQQPLN